MEFTPTKPNYRNSPCAVATKVLAELEETIHNSISWTQLAFLEAYCVKKCMPVIDCGLKELVDLELLT